MESDPSDPLSGADPIPADAGGVPEAGTVGDAPVRPVADPGATALLLSVPLLGLALFRERLHRSKR